MNIVLLENINVKAGEETELLFLWCRKIGIGAGVPESTVGEILGPAKTSEKGDCLQTWILVLIGTVHPVCSILISALSQSLFSCILPSIVTEKPHYGFSFVLPGISGRMQEACCRD